MWMAVALLGAAGLGAVLASCVASTRVDLSTCDAVVTRCNTVCDTWCDDWGCYPDCYDSCWDDCVIDPNRAAAAGDGRRGGSTAVGRGRCA
jgi:hypothetical protein